MIGRNAGGKLRLNWMGSPFLILLFILISFRAGAQQPPRPVTVVPITSLTFGAFYQSGAGTVSVDNSGTRTFTGGIILLLGHPGAPAVLRISGNPGTKVNIELQESVIMNGDGGGTITLYTDENTDPISPFVLSGGSPSTVDLHIGGTIDVPAARPRGTYGGTFTITFHQE